MIQECFQKYNEYEPHILTSGGKDSSVEMYLVRKVKQNTHAYANNTTLDCADTYLHLKTIENLDIINPKEGFYQWRERMNFIPTRFARACCDIFKEGAMMDYLDTSKKMVFFLGMRNEESSNRSNYLDYWDNQKWSKEWKGCLPIRKWTELEIWLKYFSAISKFRLLLFANSKTTSAVGSALKVPPFQQLIYSFSVQFIIIALLFSLKSLINMSTHLFLIDGYQYSSKIQVDFV